MKIESKHKRLDEAEEILKRKRKAAEQHEARLTQAKIKWQPARIHGDSKTGYRLTQIGVVK